MQLPGSRAHIEYLSKVLGVQTVLSSAQTPHKPEVLLRVLVESSDYQLHQTLFEKIVAAWNLDARFVETVQVKSFSDEVFQEHEGANFVLVFAPTAQGEFPPYFIFASSLAQLAEETSLKKKLWEQIQQARHSLNEIVVGL